MKWTVADARKSFSELLKKSGKEPQMIYRRHEHVAVVVDPDMFRDFLDWLKQRDSRTVGEAFAQLRAVCEQEDYELLAPDRSSRPDSFSKVLDELSD